MFGEGGWCGGACVGGGVVGVHVCLGGGVEVHVWVGGVGVDVVGECGSSCVFGVCVCN